MLIRDLLCEMGFEDSLVFDSPEFDNAIVGVTEDSRVVYDFNKMVALMVERDNVSESEAIEFIEYNTIRSIPYAGELAPTIMYPIEGWSND